MKRVLVLGAGLVARPRRGLVACMALRYERACDFRGAGSATILTVTTLPGNDVTHPVPDNTGYITEGQFYLHDGMIDPFGSLSRLKQQVIGKVTREDHGQIMNTMIRFYAEALEAEKKKAEGLKKIAISPREKGDLIMMGIGGFSPLYGFMTRADWKGVCENFQMADGTVAHIGSPPW